MTSTARKRPHVSLARAMCANFGSDTHQVDFIARCADRKRSS
jgi:hypothetical protein